jgi:benzil reductase ((S)-benzoin forming)
LEVKKVVNEGEKRSRSDFDILIKKEMNRMNYFIITGASRGLGEAIAKTFMQKGNRLFCISRKKNDDLIALAEQKGVMLDYLTYDLSEPYECELIMEQVFSNIHVNEAALLYLINNAGMIEPIKPSGKADNMAIVKHIQLNLMAPMILTNEFIKRTKDSSAEKVVVNVSSGAANRPVFGWNAYCSSKAGLDMFTKTVGLEQANEDHPVKVISFSPGVMDTNMQKTIRSSEKNDFADVEQFQGYHEKGMLRSPEFVAGVLRDLLFNKGIENGKVYDIKQLI